jgi:hypothetical protein
MNSSGRLDFELMIRRAKLFWIGLPIAVGLVTPSAVIFYLEVFVGHVSPVAAIQDIGWRQFAEGHNLFLLAVFSLIPFVLLSVISLLVGPHLPASRQGWITLGGLIGILAFMVPSHVAVWYPLYGGGHMSSTAVIAFIFIPFYCVVTLIVGLFVGWAASLLPPLRNATEKE